MASQEFIFHEDYTGPRFTYGVTLRPVARFNIPDGWVIGSDKPHKDFKSFGTVDYPFQLASDVASHYSLVLVTDEEKPRPSLSMPSWYA